MTGIIFPGVGRIGDGNLYLNSIYEQEKLGRVSTTIISISIIAIRCPMSSIQDKSSIWDIGLT